MKKILTAVLCVMYFPGFAQSNTDVKLQDLSVPQSPGFQLIDIAPTNIEAHTTPKSFVVGILQSYDANARWPQNYSMETAPYWWFKSSNKNIYSFLGIAQNDDGTFGNQQIFSGLKFSSLSVAFTTKDMIPDTFNSTQKIFSVGFRSTVIKVYKKKHIDDLKAKINTWANTPIPADLAIRLAGRSDAEIQKIVEQYWQDNPDALAGVIADLAAEKPIFSWSIAGAYATYGIGDSSWQTGRSGLWTTIATNLPLFPEAGKAASNYLSILANARYLNDQYTKSDDGRIVASNMLDAGGKIEIAIENFSFAYEAMYRRFLQTGIKDQFRQVGTINYKIQDGLFINGSFGKNFGDANNTIVLFGLNWGFGSEKLNTD